MGKYLDDLFLYPGSWVDGDVKGFAAAARSWAEKEILADRLVYQKDYEAQFPEKSRKLTLDIGFEKLVLPVENGGYGWNEPSNAPGILTVFTEVARGDETIAFISSLKFAVFSIMAMKPNMDKALLNELIPIYFAGRLADVAIMMPGPGIAGEDGALFAGRSIPAKAKPVKNGFEISGRQIRPLGPGFSAALFAVVCADNDGRACLAFVPSDAKGVQKGEPLKTTGLNACMNADITFDKVRIPREHLVSRQGVVQELYAWLNLLLGGTSIGAALNFFEILTSWSENRTIKGKDILKENPLCASVLATVAEEIAHARLMAYSLSHIMAHAEDWGGVGGNGAYTFAQMLGCRIQQSCLNALNKGMELMGSAGYAKEWHVEKHWRDIKTIQSSLCGLGADVPVKMDIARYFFDCKEV